MEFFKFLAWLLLNVGVPVLAPIALLPLLGLGKKYKGKVKMLIRRSLQEGQLFWTVIAMCAAAWYEAASHMNMAGTQEQVENIKIIGWIAIGWHIAIIIGSSVLVLLGTMDAADEEAHVATHEAAEAGGTAPSIMKVSILITAITAVTFTATHLWAG